MYFPFSSIIIYSSGLPRYTIDILFCSSLALRGSGNPSSKIEGTLNPRRISLQKEALRSYRATVSYPDRPHVFLLSSPAVSTELSIQPLADVPGALRGRYDVERRRHGPALLKITDPKFAPREFPLDVGALLIGNTKCFILLISFG